MRQIIFGCGLHGKDYFKSLSSEEQKDIVFYDNDRRLWGGTVFGKSIITLDKLEKIVGSVDYKIIVAVHQENALYFLKDLGVVVGKAVFEDGTPVKFDDLKTYPFDIRSIEEKKLLSYEKVALKYKDQGKQKAYEHALKYIEYKKKNIFSPEMGGIEFTNYCNLSCPNCPTPNCKRDKGYMSEDVFNKCLEYIPPKQDDYFSVHGLGEPLLHPQFVPYLKKLAEIDTPILISSNGVLFDEGMIEQVIPVMSELSRGMIYISFHTSKSVENWIKLRDLVKNKNIENIQVYGQILEHNDKQALAWLDACGVKDVENDPGIRYVTSHSFAGNVSARRSNYCETEVQNRYRNCYAINANRCPVAWDGRLKGCCLDSELEAGVGDIFNIENARLSFDPYKLCYHCDPDWMSRFQ